MVVCAVCLAAVALTLPRDAASAPPRLLLLGWSYDPGRQVLLAVGPVGAKVTVEELTPSGPLAVDSLDLVTDSG